MREYSAESFLSVRTVLGEGPIWDPRYPAYWWIDIIGQHLFQFEPGTQQLREWSLDQMPGTVVARKSGGLMLAVQNGFAAFDPESGQLEMVAEVEADMPENRFNDGKCDPAGRFWAGTMRIDDHNEIFTGSLYSLETDGRVIKRLGDIGVSNGIVWSRDASRMYFIDSPRHEIYGFDYDPITGNIKNRSVVFSAPQELGAPDGMAIDSDDKLWVAFWGGWCVAQICPETGELLAKVPVPVAQCSACALGGTHLDQLLITTAVEGLTDEERAAQPLAGGLFVANVPAHGLKQPEYGG